MAGSPPTDEQAQAVQTNKGTGVFVPRDNSAARHRMLQARARSNLPTDCARSSRSDAGHSPASNSGTSNASRGTARQEIHISVRHQHPTPAMTGSVDTISSIFEYSHSNDFQFSETPAAVSTPVLHPQGLKSTAEFTASPYSGPLGADLPLQSLNDFWSLSGASSPLASSIIPAASISSFSSDFSSSTTSNGSLVNIDALCEQLALLQHQDKLLQEKEHNLVMQQKLLQRMDSSGVARSYDSSNINSGSMVDSNSCNSNSLQWSYSGAMQQWQSPASYPLQSNSSMFSAVPAALAMPAAHSAASLQLPVTPGHSSAPLHLSRTVSAAAAPAGSGLGNWNGNFNYYYNSTAWQASPELPSAPHAAAADTAWQSPAPVAASAPAIMPTARAVQDVYSSSSYDQGTRSAASMAAKIAQLSELQALQHAIQQELLQLLC